MVAGVSMDNNARRRASAKSQYCYIPNQKQKCRTVLRDAHATQRRFRFTFFVIQIPAGVGPVA